MLDKEVDQRAHPGREMAAMRIDRIDRVCVVLKILQGDLKFSALQFSAAQEGRFQAHAQPRLPPLAPKFESSKIDLASGS